MASFPTSVKTFTSVTDGVDYVEAVDVNELQQEVNAIEATLKINWGGTPTTGDVLYYDGTSWTKTSTLTTINVKPRNVTVTQAAAPAWNCDNGDIFTIDALAQAITSMTTNQTGTPVDRQEIDFEITDNATPRAITWGANFLGSSGTALPSTTVLSKTLYVKFRYNGAVWICLASTSAL